MFQQKARSCSDIAHLQKYLREELDEAEETQVQEHLGTCAECQAALERTAGDPSLWADVKRHFAGEAGEETESPSQDGLAELIEWLGPTDDPEKLGRLGSYEVVGWIGRGGTGIVMKALEPRLNRFVAIKLMLPSFLGNGAARRRFEREGRAVAAVSHEHVVPIYAVDDHRGLPYIVMKYIPGLSLSQRIDRDCPLDTCEVTRVGLQVAQGLAAAHAQGIVHRDVKPANVIMEDTVDRAMVTDFGLARMGDEVSMTRSGTITGTPQYMSPEQASGDGVDPRTDLFSLGSLLYTACTGRPPFRAETVFGVIRRVCESEPRAIREINPGIDEWLVAFIDKLMAKRPEERFASAGEVAELLEAELAYLQAPTSVARPARPWHRRPARRGPGAWALAGIGAAGLGGLAALGFAFLGEDDGASGGGSAAEAGMFQGVPGALAPAIAAAADQEDPGEVTWTREESDWDTDLSLTFEQRYERTFPAADLERLRVDVERGDVVVRAEDVDEVTVTVLRRVKAGTRAEAEALVAGHVLDLGTDGGELSLTAKLASAANAGEPYEDFGGILFRLSVPTTFQPEVRSASGNVTIAALSGDVVAETGCGDIRLGDIAGNLRAEAQGGDIEAMQGCDDARLTAIGGDVLLAGCRGSAYVKASGGKAMLGENPGAITAQVTGGDIRIRGLAGPLNAYTEDGDIIARLADSPPAAVKLHASAGSVEMFLTEAVALDLRVQGELDAPFEAELVESSNGTGDTWFVAELNGGGPQVEAFSSTGTVTVRYREPEDVYASDSLGGSGRGVSKRLSEAARRKTAGDPRPGGLVSVSLPDEEVMDGYTLYLPVSHAEHEGTYPVLVYLQGGYGVGGEIGNINHWGLPRLLRDENDLSSERNRFLLDGFIVVSPHIQSGQYHDHPEVVQRILSDVGETYKADLERVFLTGLSRGGHGTWGLASKLPGTFSAIVPIGASSTALEDYSSLGGTAVWIAHNRHDGIVPFSYSEEAVAGIEAACGVEFLELDRADLPDSDYLERDYVFSYTEQHDHDAWTDLYTSVEFYRWLSR